MLGRYGCGSRCAETLGGYERCAGDFLVSGCRLIVSDRWTGIGAWCWGWHAARGGLLEEADAG